MNILVEIKNDHDKARGLMLEVENNEEQAMQLFCEMTATVLAHHEAEEQVLFPKLIEADKETILNLIAEHDALRRSVQYVLDTPESDDNWKARFHVVKDLFYHHIQEEEEKLFELVRESLPEEMMESITDVFEKREEKSRSEKLACIQNGLVLTDKDIKPLSSKITALNKGKGETSKAR